MVAVPRSDSVMLARVIVASDDSEFRRRVLETMAFDGPWLVAARPFAEARELAAGADAVLVIADVRATDPEALAGIGASSNAVVIAVVSDSAGTAAALSHGADDAIVWPGSAAELSERARRAATRLATARPAAVIHGPSGIRLYPRAHEAYVRDTGVELTPKEFMILQMLLDNLGGVLTADDLSSALWGHETFGARNFVEAHISRLRQKLKAAGASDIITTIRGVGYKIR